MTFAARPHQVLGPSLGVQPLNMGLGGVAGSSTNKAVSFTFNTDGTLSFTNNLNVQQDNGVPSNWYLPTTAGIGSGYRVRFTLQAGGNAWDTGLANNTLYALSSARTLTWTLAPGASVYAQVLVEIVSSANTTVLGSGIMTVSMYSEY